MKRIKGTNRIEILEGEVIDTWKHPDRVSLTKAELKQLEYNKRAWSILLGCGAALCVVSGLWLVSLVLKPQPAILPKCESNCNIHQGLL